VATQFFYTLSFINILIAIILVVMYMLCIQESYKVVALRWIGIDLAIAGNKMPYPASISLSNLPFFPILLSSMCPVP